jgi:phage terminase small subunit
MAKLTDKQRRFVEEYCIDFNATQAAIRAKYSQKTAGRIGQQNLQKLVIQKAIAEHTKKLTAKSEITVERVLEEYKKLAFVDPSSLFHEDGSPKDITEIDKDTVAALGGLDVQEVYEGYGEDRVFVGYVKKYKLIDKKGALDSLAKHLGMFTENINLTGPAISETAKEMGEYMKSRWNREQNTKD